jgi:hypothetical protein
MAIIIHLPVKSLDTKTLALYLCVKIYDAERRCTMIRPYDPGAERARQQDILASVAGTARHRPDGARRPRSASRPALALAGALRRMADRLDASETPAPSAQSVAGPC